MMKAAVAAFCILFPATAQVNERLFASLSEKQARNMISSARVKGQVGKSLDFRVTGTDRSYNYKLRATWITPDVAAAAARLLVSAKGLTEQKALDSVRALDREFFYFVIELDPREGSGVIPKDWLTTFGPREQPARASRGEVLEETQGARIVASAFPRDYAYDMFIVRFARKAGDAQTFNDVDREAELTVRIYNKIERIHWPLSGGISW